MMVQLFVNMHTVHYSHREPWAYSNSPDSVRHCW